MEQLVKAAQNSFAGWRWQLISTLTPPDVRPVRDQRAAWRKRHTHAHRHQELLVALAGRTAYGHAGAVYPCAPGSVFFFDRSEPHDSGYPSRSGPLSHLWLSLMDDQVLAFIIRCSGARLRFGEERRVISHGELGLNVPALLPRAGIQPPSVIRLRLLSLAQMVLSRLCEGGGTATPDAVSVQVRSVAAIQRHIAETAGNGASLENLARAAGYSRFHFLRLFRKHAGCNLQEYIDDCRAARFRELRAQGKLFKEISAALGFSCPASFSRWKRRVVPESGSGNALNRTAPGRSPQ